MIDFYKKMSEDMSLALSERKTYEMMYKKFANDEYVEELKQKAKKKSEADLALAEKEDEGCEGGGCKI